MKKGEIKIIFFDFDLTLADTRKFVKRSYLALCRISGLKQSKKGFEDYVGKRVSENIDFFARKSGLNKQKLYKTFFKAHENEEKEVKIYNKEILSFLKNKKIKVIILSDNSRKIIKKVLHYNKMHFDRIIADEDMKKGEEKHDIISNVLKRMDKSKALYVGDHIKDIKEAKKAGVKIASVTTGVFSAERLKKYKPDFIIKNLNKIKLIINNKT